MDYIKDIDWQIVSFVALRLLQEMMLDPLAPVYGFGGKNKRNEGRAGS